MAFRIYTTYGKRRNRIVKTDAWLTPEKTKYFSSCSSDTDSDENTSRSTIENEQLIVAQLSEQKDLDKTSSSSGFVSRISISSSKDHNSSSDLSELVKKDTSPIMEQNSDHTNSLFLEHSTPLSSKNLPKTITTRLKFKEISPFPSLGSYHANCNNNTTAKTNDPSLDLFLSPTMAVINEDNCKPPSQHNVLCSTSKESDNELSSISKTCMSGLSLRDSSKESDTDRRALLLRAAPQESSDNDSKLSCIKESQTTSYSLRSSNRSSASDIRQVSDQMEDLKLFDGEVCLDAHEPFYLLRGNQKEKSKSSEKESVINGIDSKSKRQSYVKTISYDVQDSSCQRDAEESHKENRMPVTSTKSNAELGKSLSIFPSTPINLCLRNVTERSLSFVEALTPLRFQRRKTLSPKEKILLQCEQLRPLKFTEALADEALEDCAKVGEGTYGEVFKTNAGNENVAIKIIPVEGDFPVNDEDQKSFQEIIPEIVISKELSELCKFENAENYLNACPNFIKVKRVMLIQDSYPEKLLREWDDWKQTHECENDRPDMYPGDQYFIAFEFVDGGEQLETFQFSTLEEALSILRQTVFSLAVAEQALEFEHRDLHWGNVLVKRTKPEILHYKLEGETIEFENNGVFVSIIDFTLSRLTKDGVTVFCDLSEDPDIFIGKGDYQFEVYRLMRKGNEDNWESHDPRSNVLWIRYLVDKILNFKKFPIKDKSLVRNVRAFLRRVLSYNSAMEVAQDELMVTPDQ